MICLVTRRRGELARDANTCPDRVRGLHERVASHAHVAGVRRDQRREDVHRRCLAGAVRPEERKDRSLCDPQVNSIQDGLLAEGLAKPRGLDRQG
jgi:hypothetical protein